jgi:hypothetical protein
MNRIFTVMSMIRIFGKMLILGIFPAHVASTGVPSNCTILEWNVGVYGFFSEDFLHFQKTNGVFDVMRTIAFFDLDFQSTWNTTVKARWGQSFYARSIEMNPCLRFRPIVIDAPNDLKTEYMKAQINSFWAFDAIDIDVLAYLPMVPAENILHSGVQGKVSVGLLPMEFLSDKKLYPFLFRYADPSGDEAKVAYRYFVDFGWRSITVVYDESQDGMAKFRVFCELWNADNRSTLAMNIFTVPSAKLPYKKTAIHAFIKMIRASTTRLLYVDIEAGWNFASDRYCKPLNLNVCFLRDMFEMNVKAPQFQYLITSGVLKGIEFIDDSHGIPEVSVVRVLVDGNAHFIKGHALSVDPVNFPWALDALMNQVFRVKPSDYANAYTRYGIDQWTQDTWTSFWQDKVLQGKALAGWPSSFQIMRLMYYLGDALAFILFGLNDVMDKYQPTSKSQITTKMMADAMSSSRPTFTTFGGSEPFTMPYPDQKVLAPSVVWQRMWRNKTEGILIDYAICCNGSYYRAGIPTFVDEIPTWSTGNASQMPSPMLLNCTPGQYMLPLGLCEWCPAGRFSGTFDQTSCDICPRGKTSVEKSAACVECDVGRVAGEPQMEDCVDCVAGTYASSKGLSQCSSCEFGQYASFGASTGCTRCGGDLTTESMGAVLPTDCICPKGTFSRAFRIPNSSDGEDTSCEACMLGLDCESNWPRSWNAVGNSTSLAKPGFYTKASDPYEPYKCCYAACEEDCPGGAPETCGPDRNGLVCDTCAEEGYFINGSSCQQCPVHSKLLVLFIVIVSCLGCCFAYYLTNGRLTVDADNPLAMFLFLGLVVTTAQIFGILKDLDIPWPKSVDVFMTSAAAAFTLDAHAVPLECAVGDWAVARYLVQVLLPYMLLLEILVLFLGSKLVASILSRPSTSWRINETLNVAGQIMQFLFIAFCGIMLKPLQCYRHPNNKWSLKMYPRVLCDEGGDHLVLMVLGALIGFGFLLPFMTWCVWGCVKAPSESSKANSEFLQRFRFLLYRFRPDYWWWGLCFLLRQTVLAFASVLLIENPHGQLFYAGSALAVYGFLVCRCWPWISGELGFIDAGSMLALLLIVQTATNFLPEPSDSKGRSAILLALFVTMGALLVRFFIILVRSVIANGVSGEFGTGSPDRIETSKKLLQWLEYMEKVPNADVTETICMMNGFDRSSMVHLMSSWNAVSEQGVTGGQKRLSGVPSRFKVSKETTSQLDRQSSRLSRMSESGGIKPKETLAASEITSLSLSQESTEAQMSSALDKRLETDSEAMHTI